MSFRYTLPNVINTATFLQSISLRHLLSMYRCSYGYTGNFCELGLSRGVPPTTSKRHMMSFYTDWHDSMKGWFGVGVFVREPTSDVFAVCIALPSCSLPRFFFDSSGGCIADRHPDPSRWGTGCGGLFELQTDRLPFTFASQTAKVGFTGDIQNNNIS